MSISWYKSLNSVAFSKFWLQVKAIHYHAEKVSSIVVKNFLKASLCMTWSHKHCVENSEKVHWLMDWFYMWCASVFSSHCETYLLKSGYVKLSMHVLCLMWSSCACSSIQPTLNQSLILLTMIYLLESLVRGRWLRGILSWFIVPCFLK